MLGIKDYPYNDAELLLNEICEYVFDIGQKNNGTKNFDIEQDFPFYFCDFMRIGINLNTTEISWWEFNTLLEGMFLNEKSTISTVLGYRTYKKPPKNPTTLEAQQDRFYREMKRKYSLKKVNNSEKGFEKLWSYVESKVNSKV